MYLTGKQRIPTLSHKNLQSGYGDKNKSETEVIKKNVKDNQYLHSTVWWKCQNVNECEQVVHENRFIFLNSNDEILWRGDKRGATVWLST